MATKAITETPTERPPHPSRRPDGGPSHVREDDLNVGRFVGLLSGCLVLFGSVILVLVYGFKMTPLVGAGWASLALAVGTAGLLFHAAFDRDVEFRRAYLFVGFGLTGAGALLTVLPIPKAPGDLFGLGFAGMMLGLFFQVAVLRNETESRFRSIIQLALGAVGGLMAVAGLLVGFVLNGGSTDFLLSYGLLLALLGLGYLVASVSVKGTSDDLSYAIGMAIGGLGALVFLLALTRTLLPGWFGGRGFLVPWGFLLMALGVGYGLVSIGLVSDNRLVVMTRREIGAFFYSPVAYIVLFAYAFAHWLAYLFVVWQLWGASNPPMGEPPSPFPEPIVPMFILSWTAILMNVFVIPALTMRLLSEERRTGTLEVLLTTPVNETGVVLSKFFAALMMYLVMWIPFGLLLIALRIGGGKPFDFHPLLGFSICLLFTGAHFISVGLFFSSLTRNQIVSAVLTFTYMLSMTVVFLIKIVLYRDAATGFAPTILNHISYINIWISTLEGKLVPRYLVFHATAAIFWLFASVKVLDARKWS
jgi:ABC-2 type transport system permease protein